MIRETKRRRWRRSIYSSTLGERRKKRREKKSKNSIKTRREGGGCGAEILVTLEGRLRVKHDQKDEKETAEQE